MTRGELNPGVIKTFITAGNAIITVESKSTGKWYTYKIRRKDGKNGWYVYLLTGPDNISNYSYIGKLHNNGRFYRKVEGAGAKGFEWLWGASEGKIEAQSRVWHEGRCGRCGRRLTVPESVYTGYGPECIRFMI